MSDYSEKLKQVLKVGDTVSVPRNLGYKRGPSKEREMAIVQAISKDTEHVNIKFLGGPSEGNVVEYNIDWLKLELKK